MNAALARLSMIGVLLMLASCGGNETRLRPTLPSVGPPNDVALRVDNQSWCRVTVYRLHNGGGSSVKLGEVEAMSDRIFRVDVDDGQLHVGIRPFACAYGPMTSNPVQVASGSRVTLTIPPYVPGLHSAPAA